TVRQHRGGVADKLAVMDSALVYVVIAAVLLVFAVAALVVVRQRKPGEPTAPPSETAPADTAPPVEAPAEEPGPAEGVAPEIEKPEPVAGRLQRLRARLARSQSSLGRGLLALISSDKLDDDTWEEIEDTLIAADVGVAPTQELVEKLRTRIRVEGIDTGEGARAALREELIALVDPDFERALAS